MFILLNIIIYKKGDNNLKAIIVNDKIISICDKPNYVKLHPYVDCYISCDESEAIGISAGSGEDGGIFNLPGRNDIPDAPTAYVKDDEGREYFYTIHNTALKSAEDVEVIEEAICDSDITTGDRIAVIEEVLCELDSSA